MTRTQITFLVIFLVLLCDQTLKIWVKTHMMLGQEFHILGNWFVIHFVENKGMAFGWDLPGKFGKPLLTIFRLIAATGIGWYISQLIREKVEKSFIVSMSLIWAGAFGNIIDSLFYGLIFNDSYYQIASFFPDEGGYGKLFYGKVVDMFYFPVISGHYPHWFPFISGNPFLFFRPVFNLADSSITIGVFIILLFQRKYFK